MERGIVLNTKRLTIRVKDINASLNDYRTIIQLRPTPYRSTNAVSLNLSNSQWNAERAFFVILNIECAEEFHTVVA